MTHKDESTSPDTDPPTDNDRSTVEKGEEEGHVTSKDLEYDNPQEAIDDHHNEEHHSPPRRRHGVIDEQPSQTKKKKKRTRNRSKRTKASSFLLRGDVTFRPGRRIVLYTPPKQRQKWNDTQVLPRTNFGDLFFDLFYVAATYAVSLVLVENPDKYGALYASATFLPVMGIWMERTNYDARYTIGSSSSSGGSSHERKDNDNDNDHNNNGNHSHSEKSIQDDAYHQVLHLAQLVILATAIVSIRSVNDMSNSFQDPSMFMFALSLVLERLHTILKHVEIYFKGIGQEQPMKASAKSSILYAGWTLCFYLAATIVAGLNYYYYGPHQGGTSRRILAETSAPSQVDHVPIVLVLVGYLLYMCIVVIRIVFCAPPGGQHKKFNVPLNIDFVIHRNGEWTMLMLGESILSLLIVDAPPSNEFFATFYCSVLTVILLQILHFWSQPHSANHHALRRHKNAGAFWFVLQHIYSLFLVTLGAAFTFFLLEFSNFGQEIDPYDADAKRQLDEHGIRWLAGEEASQYDADYLRKKGASMFSASLAVIFFSLDSMTLLHLGIKESQGRCMCEKTKRKNYRGFLLLVLRVGLMVFAGTLTLWTNEPETLSFVGVLCVLAQLGLRKLGETYLSHRNIHDLQVPPDEGQQVETVVDHSPEDEMDLPVAEKDESLGEAQWPNVTQARAKHDGHDYDDEDDHA